MATTTIEGALVLKVPTELLGPGSEYDRRRILLKRDVEQLVLDASKITAVTTADEAEQANNAGRVLQASMKEVEQFFKPLKVQVDDFKKPLLAHEKEFSLPLDAEKKRLGSLLTPWSEKLRQEREAEERRKREEADRIAREEQLARAVELEAAGDLEAAEQVLEEPIFSPVVTQAVAPPKVAGQVNRVNYSARVVNFKELLKAVADGRAPVACVTVDESYINGLARLNKEGFSLPGCELVKTAATSFRS